MLSGASLSAQSVVDTFQKNRSTMLRQYNSYRNDYIDRYASFLENAWRSHECFKGMERGQVPKPEKQPVAEFPVPSDGGRIPVPKGKGPQTPGHNNDGVRETAPAQIAEPTGKNAFSFYGMTMPAPDLTLPRLTDIVNRNGIADNWRQLASDPHIERAASELLATADTLGLNDYLKYEFVSSWAASVCGKGSSASTKMLVHFILVKMGYDVRLALTSNSDLLFLISCHQQVFARPFLKIGNRNYYVFGTEADPTGSSISTYDIPETEVYYGQQMDLRLHPLRLPYRPGTYHISHAGITIEGEYNANIFPLLYRYPQMPISDYVVSEADPELRRSVVSQIRNCLNGMKPETAADSLLRFVQSGFTYATDPQFHGFEKPYFFEEMLYYPVCDCEDRAIFYAYLLHNALDLDCQLINYPGHESVGIKLNDNRQGDFYENQGSRFYISDPTYIGASTGMCMPKFRNIKPEIDYSYSH